jgi:hypothetical protein
VNGTKCASCGEELAANASRIPYPAADPYEAWLANQTASILQHFDFRPGNHPVFLENLSSLVSLLGGLKPAARALGVGSSSLWSWRSGESDPGLDAALRFSWAAQVPLVEFLTSPVREIVPRVQFPVWRPRQKRRVDVTAKDYINALHTFLARYPFAIPSGKTLQQLVGGSHRHPELNKPTVQTALAIARQRRLLTRHRHAVWTVVCRVHRAYRACIQAGRPLTIRNLCAYGAHTRSEISRRYFLKLRQRHDAGREAPNPHNRLPRDVVSYWTSLGLM